MPYDLSLNSLGFIITKNLEEGLDGNKDAYVGITFKMVRILSPFIFQYHLPAAAIVFVSQVSFIIPPSAIPGRIGLLATLFLTLINLFINHMVSSINLKQWSFVHINENTV